MHQGCPQVKLLYYDLFAGLEQMSRQNVQLEHYNRLYGVIFYGNWLKLAAQKPS